MPRTTDDQMARARDMGREAAVAAASWAAYENTKREFIPALLALLDGGDPRAYLPAYPTLSGEWADGLTPITLWEFITGENLADAQEAGSAIDALADEWEAAVAETFYAECERVLRTALV